MREAVQREGLAKTPREFCFLVRCLRDGNRSLRFFPDLSRYLDVGTSNVDILVIWTTAGCAIERTRQLPWIDSRLPLI